MAEVIVETACRRVRGREERGVSVFKGIPYAAPPLGENRFRPPRKSEPWSGVRDALVYGDQAIQDDNVFNLPADLLAIVPLSGSREDQRGLPHAQRLDLRHGRDEAAGAVLVPWRRVHRGLGVVALVRRHQPVPARRRRGRDLQPSPGRAGLSPSRGHRTRTSRAPAPPACATSSPRWNGCGTTSRRFGGDPGNVTIFGESGGGAKVSVLMALPAAKGLFHKAVIQSGPAVQMATREDGTKTALQVLAELGLGDKDAPRSCARCRRRRSWRRRAWSRRGRPAARWPSGGGAASIR